MDLKIGICSSCKMDAKDDLRNENLLVGDRFPLAHQVRVAIKSHRVYHLHLWILLVSKYPHRSRCPILYTTILARFEKMGVERKKASHLLLEES